MKRARPVASLARSATTVELVRIGGGWTGDHARFAKLDPYRAQTSPRKRAELTRIAYMLEALPASRTRVLVLVARTDDPVAVEWLASIEQTARTMGYSPEREAVPGSGIVSVAVHNDGSVKRRRDPHEYDRRIAKANERFAKRRERSGADQATARKRAEDAWWRDQAEADAARWAKHASDPAIPLDTGDDEIPF